MLIGDDCNSEHLKQWPNHPRQYFLKPDREDLPDSQQNSIGHKVVLRFEPIELNLGFLQSNQPCFDVRFDCLEKFVEFILRIHDLDNDR